MSKPLELGTPPAFAKFMVMQAKVYAIMVENAYGLPDAESHQKDLIEVSVAPPISLSSIIMTKKDLSPVFYKLVFKRTEINLFGEPCVVWMRHAP